MENYDETLVRKMVEKVTVYEKQFVECSVMLATVSTGRSFSKRKNKFAGKADSYGKNNNRERHR